MKRFMLACVALTICGCATVGRMNRLSVGMDRTEVIKAMGRPKTTAAQGEREYLVYYLYETDSDAFVDRPTEYFVRIIGGKVEAFGKRGDFEIPRSAVDLSVK